jgi:TonB family protein
MPRLRFLYNIAAFAALLSPGLLKAQTCMINCGVDAGGVQTYMEVYEYDFVSEKPSFPGGNEKLLNYINKTRVYPKQAYKNGYQGRVLCSFVINTDGSVSNVQVLRGVERSLNCEAVRIFSKMPDWIPGKLNGVPVPVRVIYPVTFRK